MAYAVLWVLVVSVCYVDERECESTDVYFYDSKEECLYDLEFLHDLDLDNQEELSTELKCEMR